MMWNSIAGGQLGSVDDCTNPSWWAVQRFQLRVGGVQAQRAGFAQYVNAQVTGVLPISSLVFNRQPSAVKKDLEITY